MRCYKLLRPKKTQFRDILLAMNYLNKALREKSPTMPNMKDIIMHHDNAKLHDALATLKNMAELGWEIITHLIHSSNLDNYFTSYVSYRKSILILIR